MDEELLTYKDTAKILGLPVGTLYALVSTRAIPHIRLSKRIVRFARADLHTWVNAKRVNGAGGGPSPQ